MWPSVATKSETNSTAELDAGGTARHAVHRAQYTAACYLFWWHVIGPLRPGTHEFDPAAHPVQALGNCKVS